MLALTKFSGKLQRRISLLLVSSFPFARREVIRLHVGFEVSMLLYHARHAFALQCDGYPMRSPCINRACLREFVTLSMFCSIFGKLSGRGGVLSVRFTLAERA